MSDTHLTWLLGGFLVGLVLRLYARPAVRWVKSFYRDPPPAPTPAAPLPPGVVRLSYHQRAAARSLGMTDVEYAQLLTDGGSTP